MIKVAAERMAFLLVLSLCSFSAFAEDTSTADPWHVMNAVTRDTLYVLWQGDRVCTTGRISGVDDYSVRLVFDSGSRTGASRPRIIERRDIVRITDLSDDIHHLAYSGRSSWADVQQLEPLKHGEELLTITGDGRGLDSESVDVASNAMVFGGVRKTPVLKWDVRAGYSPITFSPPHQVLECCRVKFDAPHSPSFAVTSSRETPSRRCKAARRRSFIPFDLSK